jgi:SAM-dependent methyltransferase
MMLDVLFAAARRPELYVPGEELWNDPHIAKGMLQAHLAPDTDAASYRPERIKAICGHLPGVLGLQPGDRLADLGCGPGLYCARLAALGYYTTGIDRSENSICYARAHASNREEYRLASYLEPFGEACYDAALMISQDYGVLNLENRRRLLGNIRRALKPGGFFAFDVPGMAAYQLRMDAAPAKWYASEPGFWRPHPYFVLEDVLFYPEISALCDRYVVLDGGGMKVYRVWQTFFSPESIRLELEENGFQVEAALSNLRGDAYDAASPEIGVVCRRI